MDELISRQAAITLPVMPKEHREYQTFNLDDAYEQGWNDLQKCIELLPTEQEQLDAAYKEGYCDCEQEWLKERRELHLTSIEVNEGGIVGKFTERKWIPVTERLPEANQYDEKNVAIHHLVQTEYGDMMVATYKGRMGNKWWQQIFSLDVIEDKVVAWMPLPEPWKGEEDANNNSQN